MGKPGTRSIFMAGKIYGFDQEGNDLVELRDNPRTPRIEHIPFTNFEGRRTFSEDRLTKSVPEAKFNHFNLAIGRLLFYQQDVKGEIFNGTAWVEDKPEAQKTPHQTIQTYSDFWGIRNFAMACLSESHQLEALTSYHAKRNGRCAPLFGIAPLPKLKLFNPLLSNRFVVALKAYLTVIPLQEKHLKALKDNLYTHLPLSYQERQKGTPHRLGSEKF